MGIFKRISDIISANLNELTDGLEDPEKMLRQAVREMEQAIADATQQTAKAMANERTMARELDRNRQQVKQWQVRAENAVESGDDESAKKALSRKHEHEKLAVALDDQLESAREACRALRCQLDGMKAKMAEARRNLTTLSTRKRAADFRNKMATPANAFSVDVDDNAFAKFDRLRDRVERAEAEAQALAELRSGATRETSLDDDTADEQAELVVELAELKRRLKK
ncbi:MAG: PspA/IM30 family protein [Pirellulales bacterium]